MLRTALKWGAVLGAAVCAWTLCVHSLGWYTTDLAKGERADLVATILPISVLYLAIQSDSRRRARTPALIEALSVGVLSGLVSAPLSAGFLWIYHHYINPGWLNRLVEYERQKLVSRGASEAVINAAIARLVVNGTDRSQLIGAFLGTVTISLVISVLVWGIMRFRDRRHGRLTLEGESPR